MSWETIQEETVCLYRICQSAVSTVKSVFALHRVLSPVQGVLVLLVLDVLDVPEVDSQTTPSWFPSRVLSTFHLVHVRSVGGASTPTPL